MDALKPLLWKSLGKLNKYTVVGLFFIFWMLFFAEKDIFTSFSHRQKLKDLQKSRVHLEKLIAETKKEGELLKTNAQTIEKYAREHYLMKKDNEDIFIVNSTINGK